MADVYHFQSDQSDHRERVAAFQRSVQSDLTGCIRRHITTGDPVGLSQGTYYDLRHEVAEWLKIHPSQVVVVGSCRVGFTLKPRSRYRPFGPASDVDVAIVSDRWFNRLWDSLFLATQPARDWTLTQRENRRIGRDLFNGWLTPSSLPSLPGFDAARVWADGFAEITRDGVCNRHEVRGRLYRDWSRLEVYQSHFVRRCREPLFQRRGRL